MANSLSCSKISGGAGVFDRTPNDVSGLSQMTVHSCCVRRSRLLSGPVVCPGPTELVSQNHKITQVLSPVDLGQSLAHDETKVWPSLGRKLIKVSQ